MVKAEVPRSASSRLYKSRALQSMAEKRESPPCEPIYDLKSFEYHLTRILESGKSRVCLFLGGKTGVGKSHLTNALIGEEVAEEGESLDPVTMEPTPYKTEINGVIITAWDTPGMADGSQGEQTYLTSMMTKIKEVDLFLYCAEMNTQRVRNDDIKCILDLTKAFGYRLWNNALIVLTFANEVHPPKGKKISSEAYFTERLRKFKKRYYQELQKAGIPELIVHSIPVVPVGDLHEPQLPDRENWITALWIQAFKRMAQEAQPAMLLANFHRIQLLNPGSVEDAEKLIDGSSGVPDEFFSSSVSLRRQSSSGSEVKLSPEEKRRIREARRSFQNFEEELAPTSERRSFKIGGRTRRSYEINRDRGPSDPTQTEAYNEERENSAPFDPESDRPKTKALATKEDASQPSPRAVGDNDKSKTSASSWKKSDKHKKKSANDDNGIGPEDNKHTAAVPLTMSQDSILEVIGEVSMEIRQDSGEELAQAGELIASLYNPALGRVGKFGGYLLNAIIKLMRKICEMIVKKKQNGHKEI